MERYRADPAAMQKRFATAKQLPKYLITQNDPLMKKAFTLVPAVIWAGRINSLQNALQFSFSNDLHKRVFAPEHYSETSDTLDVAFSNKYDELIGKVLYDFDGFWPYRISRTNQDLMVFDKLDDMALIEYVTMRI
jgi:hypothetical protein